MEPLLMMRPPRGSWLFMILNASCVQRNEPVRLVSTTAFHCSKGRSSSGTAGAPMPALLKSRSSRPNVSLVRAKSARTEAGSPTSVTTASVREPGLASRTTDSRASLRRPASATAYPSLRRASAEALPMPLPAPVTIATLPEEAMLVVLSGESGALGGMHLEGLVGRALEVDRHALGVADDHVVGGRLRRHVHRAQGQGQVLRLQHLAPDEGQRHTEPPVVAVALEVVGRDGDPGRVEARAREAAGLGEGEEIGAVVAAHAEHDGRLRALDLPVPVLRVDEPPSLRGLRQRDDARARLVAGDSAAKLGVAPELEDLRARVEQRDGLEVEPGALGDAAHLLDVGGLEGVHLRHVLADELADGDGVEARALELLRVVAHAQRDALGGLAAVLPA